jgi:putative hydrolases of HD superfamily
LHDAHETRVGDVPAVGRAYVTTASPEAVTAHQTAGMPADASKAIQELIVGYEDNQTPEAHLAYDADKIEMLIQAIEYQALGADSRQWQDNALAALPTDAGAELARAVTSSSPQWWAAFNASCSELRSSTRAHKQLREAVH